MFDLKRKRLGLSALIKILLTIHKILSIIVKDSSIVAVTIFVKARKIAQHSNRSFFDSKPRSPHGEHKAFKAKENSMRKLMSVRACGILIASALALALVACGGGGSSGGADASTSTSATTPAVAPATDPWWPPVIHAVGEKVTVSTSFLSPSAQKIGDTAWQQAVKDGTVKAVDTALVLTGFSARPMVWAVYFHPTDKNGTQIYCTRPVYKDDGLAVGSLEGTQGNCTTEIIDWVVGTKAVGELKGGIIRHSPVRKECYELFWNQTRQGFDDHQVTCPIF